MKVCIAEKPSVGKEIAQILGAHQRKDGYFEGNGYAVTWTFGHFCTLKEPNDYDSRLKSWNLNLLPILPEKFGIKLIGNAGVKKQFEIIKSLVDNASEVINCGDAGQEGEVIQRWVLQQAGYTGHVKRLWISSLTEESIREGFQKLDDGAKYDSLYAAGYSRAIGDWLLGLNATRLYTLKFGQNRQVLSVGRVQTPTLALIVDRTLEIQNFKVEPFWELKTKYKDVLFTAKKGKYPSKELGRSSLDRIKDEPFKIVSFSKNKGKEFAPKLYDLTSLQVECNKKFGLSADQTLKAIQALYERKLTSYPRVDTTYLSDDIYPKIPSILKKMTPYAKYIEPVLAAPIKKTKRVFDDKKVTDHHAIIPTGVHPKGVVGELAKVYDLVARRFIAVFYPECIVSKTQVRGNVLDIDFSVSGKQILDLGWRALYQKDKTSNKGSEDDQILPEFVEGETGPHVPDLQEKETKPPKHYTEGTLLRAMETAGKQVDDESLRELMKDSGIGRPSTRSNIIETILRRKYVSKVKKNLVASPIGIQLIQLIENELVKSAELTGLWEKKLREIEQGQYDPKVFLTEMKQMVSTLCEDVKQQKQMVKLGAEIPKKATRVKTSPKSESVKKVTRSTKCPKCKNGSVIKGKIAFGCSEWKSGCDFRMNFVYCENKISDTNLLKLADKGVSPKVKGLNLPEGKGDAELYLDAQFCVKHRVVQADDLICPKCKGVMIKGKAALGCSNWHKGCEVRVPFTVSFKKLSTSQFSRLLSKGETNILKGFKKSNGEDSFDAKLAFDENYKLVFKKA